MPRPLTLLSGLAFLCLTVVAFAQERVSPGPNYAQAERFSPAYISERTYSTQVQPQWIGETDRFWYTYRTATGLGYFLVDPAAATKRPLFHAARLAAALSIEVRRPLDERDLGLEKVELDDEGKTLKFVHSKLKFELDLATETLTNAGPVEEPKEAEAPRRGNRGSRDGDAEEKPDPRAHRNFSPDYTAYVFLRDGDLYFVEASEEVAAEVREIDKRLKAEEKAKREAEERGETIEEDIDDGTVEVVEDVVDTTQVVETEEVLETEEVVEGDEVVEQVEEVLGDLTTELTTTEIVWFDGDEELVDTNEELVDTNEELVDTNEELVDTDKVVDTDEVVKTDEQIATEEAEAKAKEEEDKVDEREAWADDIDERLALRLSDDFEEDYAFSEGRRWFPSGEEELDADELLERLQAGTALLPDEEQIVITTVVTTKTEDDTKTEDGTTTEEGTDEDAEPEPELAQPRVRWAPDSSAFHISRRDSRGVEQLFLVNTLSDPRPTLEQYDYPMPGEEKVGYSELHVFDRTRKVLTQVEGRWKDEAYQDLHWPKAPAPKEDPDDDDPTAEELAGAGDELRFVRRDRPYRNVELCSLDVRTGVVTSLFEEGFEGANIDTQNVRYLRDRGEMIWWSERTGWGHFYLYDQDGTLKNAITSGTYRASRIVEVDEDKGLVYFYANSREPGENVYYQHLYRCFLDGSGLTLLDPGDANHTSVLSPNQAYLVDNCSRIDMAPASRLLDAEGQLVMQLEEADLSRLEAAGWSMPETFTFKAADGVTDLYGNLWKPFDFDPSASYPVIAEVYPGPQTEGVSHSFSASNPRQQLAQVGFIVVQLGHRGGTPGRSKAYHSYGYFNLRDYGLADKKSGLEQLAERHPYIDLERVGIYGHSGGGFMSAAALLREPYNDFFKVAVASAGNHDNNVYNRYWAERYHGLREVEVKKKGKQDAGEQASKSAEGSDDEEQDEEQEQTEVRFEIDVPTNASLAANLKGHLLLVHGEMDNNVHPAGTLRLVDALIKANKRFDMLILPGKRHGFGSFNDYFTQRKWEYFAEHLLGDRQTSADIKQKE